MSQDEIKTITIPMPDPNQIVVSIPKTEPTLKANIQILAKREHRSVSNLITMVLSKYITKELFSDYEEK